MSYAARICCQNEETSRSGDTRTTTRPTRKRSPQLTSAMGRWFTAESHRRARKKARPQASLLASFLGGSLGRSRAAVRAFGDAGRLAAAIAQIIELGAPHLAAPEDFDRVDHRRIDGENALHALAIGDLPHREVLVEAIAAARDAHAFIRLNAGALAFRDLHVDDDRVAGLELRDLGPGQLGRMLGL